MSSCAEQEREHARCPRCGGDRLRRETRRIPVDLVSKHYATGGWYVCLDCRCCFDGVTDRDGGVLPWWVEKRPAGRVWSIERETEGETGGVG